MTNLTNLRFRKQVQGAAPALESDTGELQVLDGVTHISAFSPFSEYDREELDHSHLYVLNATQQEDGQAIKLLNLRFGGIGPHTRSARFADQ